MADQDLKGHDATGSPAALQTIAEVARLTVAEVAMTMLEATLMGMTHVLAIELAGALERIKALEDSHGVADPE